MILYDKTKDPAHCCGCRGCEFVCHTDAISFANDQEGFLYPDLSHDLCTDCGACERVCPIEIPIPAKSATFGFVQKAFAALHRERSVVDASSSGGLFTPLAESVLARGGSVFGAAFDERWNVRHERVDDVGGLARLRVSKYVQSDLGDCYVQARDLLKAGKPVLFTGVPCQIAGLRRFLRKDYPGLLTIDILCHGVPSPKVWQKYLQRLGGSLHGVRTRAIRGWGEAMIYSRKPGARRTTLHWMVSPYLYAFMKNLLHRPVCHACPFAGTRREGDITLGDYWGVKNHHPELRRERGVSLVLVNTPAGDQALSELSEKLHLVPSKVEWAAERNHPLQGPSEPHPRRADFFADLDRLPFAELERKYMRPSNYRTFLVKSIVKERVKDVLARMGVARFKD